MAIFNSYVTNYQRVVTIFGICWNMLGYEDPNISETLPPKYPKSWTPMNTFWFQQLLGEDPAIPKTSDFRQAWWPSQWICCKRFSQAFFWETVFCCPGFFPRFLMTTVFLRPRLAVFLTFFLNFFFVVTFSSWLEWAYKNSSMVILSRPWWDDAGNCELFNWSLLLEDNSSCSLHPHVCNNIMLCYMMSQTVTWCCTDDSVVIVMGMFNKHHVTNGTWPCLVYIVSYIAMLAIPRRCIPSWPGCQAPAFLWHRWTEPLEKKAPGPAQNRPSWIIALAFEPF